MSVRARPPLVMALGRAVRAKTRAIHCNEHSLAMKPRKSKRINGRQWLAKNGKRNRAGLGGEDG